MTVKLILDKNDLAAVRYANLFNLKKIAKDILLVEINDLSRVVQYMCDRKIKFGIYEN